MAETHRHTESRTSRIIDRIDVGADSVKIIKYYPHVQLTGCIFGTFIGVNPSIRKYGLVYKYSNVTLINTGDSWRVHYWHTLQAEHSCTGGFHETEHAPKL